MTDQPESKITRLCQGAREDIGNAKDRLLDAAAIASQSGNYELDKALTAVNQTLHGSQILLISLARLKG